jgi:hypothetical protein
MFCRIHERCYGSNGLKTVNRYPVTAPNSNTSAKPEAQQTNNARQ